MKREKPSDVTVTVHSPGGRPENLTVPSVAVVEVRRSAPRVSRTHAPATRAPVSSATATRISPRPASVICAVEEIGLMSARAAATMATKREEEKQVMRVRMLKAPHRPNN